MTARKPAPQAAPEAVEEEQAPPPPEDGFVRVFHPETGGVGDVPVQALGIYRARGWVPIDEEPTAEPEPVEPAAEPDPTV
jgi:hypothetical protein